MLTILSHSLRTGRLTEVNPFEARPPFGFPVIDFSRCTACRACVDACPTGAIRLTAGGADRQVLALSWAACTQCRDCLPACPERAIADGAQGDVTALTKAQLGHAAAFRLDAATGRGHLLEVVAQDGPSPAESARQLRERVHNRLGRSLHVRQVDAGSCNGCELEIAATGNPLYDLERFGIHFVASPRHADVLLVTGPVTRNMESALRATYEATPEPRVVVAVGACGCSGGIFGDDTYASRGGVDRIVPCDVFVPGCPPRPQAILQGLLVAMGLREPVAG